MLSTSYSTTCWPDWRTRTRLSAMPRDSSDLPSGKGQPLYLVRNIHILLVFLKTLCHKLFNLSFFHDIPTYKQYCTVGRYTFKFRFLKILRGVHHNAESNTQKVYTKNSTVCNTHGKIETEFKNIEIENLVRHSR